MIAGLVARWACGAMSSHGSNPVQHAAAGSRHQIMASGTGDVCTCVACVRRHRWWVFTNWAVLIGYIILFNLIVTFLLAVLNRASPIHYHTAQTCQLVIQSVSESSLSLLLTWSSLQQRVYDRLTACLNSLCSAVLTRSLRCIAALSGGAAVVSEDTLNDKEKARTGQGMSEDEVAHEPGAALREAESERAERSDDQSKGRKSQRGQDAKDGKDEQASIGAALVADVLCAVSRSQLS